MQRSVHRSPVLDVALGPLVTSARCSARSTGRQRSMQCSVRRLPALDAVLGPPVTSARCSARSTGHQRSMQCSVWMRLSRAMSLWWPGALLTWTLEMLIWTSGGVREHPVARWNYDKVPSTFDTTGWQLNQASAALGDIRGDEGQP